MNELSSVQRTRRYYRRGATAKTGSDLQHKPTRQVPVKVIGYFYQIAEPWCAYVDGLYGIQGWGGRMGYNHRGDGIQRCKTDGNGATEAISNTKSQKNGEGAVSQTNPTRPMLL